ncbi:peptide-methionine (R)-S-oxide reductase MsrB [Salibaculum griseiflavum]|uniref:peptide-methionine (R)-S-oxide reductase n=1 Tax=Salibaculum griseiflavum TaxID=1914409 RepID=A0A2V1P656_9RHOB|nr:peptide-methionine (R)-S-oxide reductase MsrB [Salibaculum griseiflavum]PWG17304.1 peptide-methionine (R)-S-oxide reductase [Salibaculum griseiflavum]
MNRRDFSMLALASPLAVALFGKRVAAAEGDFEVTRTEAEWREMLTDLEYRVMREEGTERAFTSPVDANYAPGLYHCRGCDQALYSSEHKFDSGTGWPSFWQALPNAIETKPDRKLLVVRTECHCDRCGSHLGHIFDDGPDPTGKRHCINGVSLVFRPA